MSEKGDINKGIFQLLFLKEGEEGTIHSICAGGRLAARLVSMGLAPGVRVKVLRNSWGRLIVLASNTRVAIGEGQASKILVTKDL